MRASLWWDQKTNPQFMNAIANEEKPTTNANSVTGNRRPVNSAAIAQNTGKRTMQNLGADRRGRSGRGYERITSKLTATYTTYGASRSLQRSASGVRTRAVSRKSAVQ